MLSLLSLLFVSFLFSQSPFASLTLSSYSSFNPSRPVVLRLEICQLQLLLPVTEPYHITMEAIFMYCDMILEKPLPLKKLIESFEERSGQSFA